ncbi:uncharacterized protein ACIQIH_009586 isoform 2-T2 [Cyanocitta cristata]
MGVLNRGSQSKSERSKTEPGFAAVGDHGSSRAPFGKPATNAHSDFHFVLCPEKAGVKENKLPLLASCFPVVSMTKTCSFSGIRLRDEGFTNGSI